MSGGETEAVVRPTKRCLDDLGLKPPSIDQPLAFVDSAVVASAQSLPARFESGTVERVRSVKDRVWFKVKTGRWRACATRLTDADLRREQVEAEERGADPDIDERQRWWLGAAGQREEGSRSDFYAGLSARLACSATADKPHGIDSDSLLPKDWDRRRLRAELAYREQSVYREVMLIATAQSLRTGKVVTADFERFSMGVVVRADRGEQYVAFIARNVFDPKRLAIMMASLPGVDPEDWQPEPGGIADLQPSSGEIIWSAILSTDAADHVLERHPWAEDDG